MKTKSAIWNKKYYDKNRLSEIKRLKESNTKRKKLFASVVDKLKSNPCIDCGNSYHHICMDFDHVKGKKEFSISSGIGSLKPIEKILLEIDKCELVCSNCHRIRTYNRHQHRLRD